MPMPLSGLALTLSSAVKNVQREIVDVQNQLSSGKKTLNPAENGIVTRLSAQATAYGTVNNNIESAQNVISVSQTALSSIASILTQMKSLATQASSSGLNSSDLTSLQTTFSELRTQITGLATDASVNGNNLLLTNEGIKVTTGIGGISTDSTSVAGLDLETGVISNISSLSIEASDTTILDSEIATTFAAASAGNTAQVDTLTLNEDLEAGDTVVIAGLTFTATDSITKEDVMTAFETYIGDQTASITGGTFSLKGYASVDAWMTAKGIDTVEVGGSTDELDITYTNVEAHTLIDAVGSANYANRSILNLTEQLTTISTGQSSLSASSTGLTAKTSAVSALQQGLQNTVDTIQNIDATAMQARLQQLNNQQSIDYYLVSQMNTEAAAILSIFR